MREILSAIKNFVLTCLIGLFAIVMVVGGAYAVFEIHILQRFLYWVCAIGGTACVLFVAGCMVKELVIDD